MISRRSWIVIVAAVTTAAAVIVLGDQYFREMLRLQPRTVAVIAVLIAIVPIVATLWTDILRDWAKKPGKRGRT